jgi:ATP-binding cassette subfamily F protein 3
MPPLVGRLRLGASLEIGYFAQVHDDLNMNNTVLDELLAHHAMLTSEARDYLARFLFTGDDVFKVVSALSGGERGRLALTLLMRQNVNFLLLDEPTNHLDIPAQEVLESVLSEFKGTILLVSHDRYLVSRLATQIWTLEKKRLHVFEGGYDEYLVKRERDALAQDATPTKAKARPRRERRRPAGDGKEQRLRQAAALEQTISDLETQLKVLSAELQAAGAAQQLDKVRQLGLEYSAMEMDLQRHLAEWSEVAGE